MKPDQSKIDMYFSRGGTIKISKSTQHKDMFNIEEVHTRKAHSIHASDDVILRMYPVDKAPKKKRIVTIIKK